MDGGLSDRALRDFAYRILKSELGEHEDRGVIIPAKASDEQIAHFAKSMSDEQLKQLYTMMYRSGFDDSV